MKDSNIKSDKPETKDAFLGLFVEPSLKEAAKAVAQREGISLSEVTRRSLRRELGPDHGMETDHGIEAA